MLEEAFRTLVVASPSTVSTSVGTLCLLESMPLITKKTLSFFFFPILFFLFFFGTKHYFFFPFFMFLELFSSLTKASIAINSVSILSMLGVFPSSSSTNFLMLQFSWVSTRFSVYFSSSIDRIQLCSRRESHSCRRRWHSCLCPSPRDSGSPSSPPPPAARLSPPPPRSCTGRSQASSPGSSHCPRWICST